VKQRKWLLAGIVWLGFIYLFTMFILVHRIDYRLSAPGNIEPIDSFIQFDVDTEDVPQYFAVYVMSIDRPTIFQFILAQFMPYVRVEPLPESVRGISTPDQFRSGQIARNTAIDASIITVFESLGLPITYEEHYLVSLIYNFISEPRLNIGDRILTVNGFDDIFEGIALTECGDEAAFEVLTRAGERRTFMIERQAQENCRFGLVISRYYDITALGLTFEVRENLVGGPSSGLMQTLYVYDLLSEQGLSRDLIVAGTGTIMIDGRVGSVGGIEQKIYTAYLDEVDVFFVPQGANYEQARAVYDRLDKPSFELIPVETFQEALDALSARAGDGS